MSDSGRSRRHRILTPKGQDYAQEILLKEVKRKSRSLTNHISLFEDLPKTKDVTLTKGELDKLEPMFRELEEAASKFLEVAQGEDKTQVVNIVNTERESVGRVTKAVTEWLEARSKEDAKSGRSETSRRSDMKSTMRLTIELIGMQSKLDNQVSLFDYLFDSKDSNMVQREFEKLEKIHNEIKDLFNSLGENVSATEKKMVTDIAGKADTQVKEIKELLDDYLKMQDEERASVLSGSRSSRRKAKEAKNIGDDLLRVAGRNNDDKESERSLGSKRSRTSRSSDITKNNKHRPAPGTREGSGSVTEQKPLYDGVEEEGIQTEHSRAKAKRAFDEASDKSRISKRSKYSRSQKSQKGTVESSPRERMVDKFWELQKRIHVQNEMIEDLLKTNNSSMMSKEMERLDELYNQMAAIGDSIKEEPLPNEEYRISEVIEEEDNRMTQIKKDVAKWMARQTERDKRSVKSGRSKVSAGSRRSLGKKGDETNETQFKHKEEKNLMDQLISLQERLNKQMLLVKDMFNPRDSEMIDGEVKVMEQVHGNMITAAIKYLDNTDSDEKFKEVQNKLIEEEQRVFEVKKEAVKWMITQAEADDRSQVSRSSRQTILSDHSARFGNRKGREGKKYTEAQRKDQLWEELGKLRVNLDAQKARCKDLVLAKDIGLLRQAMENLEETYKDATEIALLLRELVPFDEAGKIMEKVEAEETEIFQIKRSVVRIMATESGVKNPCGGRSETSGMNKEDPHPQVNYTAREDENVKSEDGKVEPLEYKTKNERRKQLKGEIAKIEARLENQKSLVNDLLQSDDTAMMSREMQALDKVYDDLIAAASDLREISSTTEAKEVSAMLDEEDANVFQVKKLVSKWMVSKAEKPAVAFAPSRERNDSSGESSSSSDDKITALRAEVKAMKRTTQTKFDLLKKTQAAEISKMEARIERDKEVEVEVEEHGKARTETSGRPPGPPAGDEPSEFVKLSELMVQTLKLQSAPKADIDIFTGDPLEYNYFVESFKDVVENLIDDPRQRLIRLLKYTRGDAKELIKHCIHEEAHSCYDTALRLLEKEYGSPFKIAAAYLEKLKSWPTIKANDALGLRELYRFLLRCSSYQNKGIVDLNSPLTIRNIQLCLPSNVQDKWTSRVGRIRKRKGEEASFTDFVEFVEEESQMLNDPVYSRGAGKEKGKPDGNIKTCLTDVEESKPEEPKEIKTKAVTIIECSCCKGEHDLDDCPDFTGMVARAKKDILFRSKMCFLCYGKGHVAKDCTNQRTCKVCGKEHPTGLHEVNFKVSAVWQESNESAMCIVPVRLHQENDPENEIEVYAMLDECSQGTFVDEKLVEKLSWQKRETTIKVETVNGVKTMNADALDNFVVRCAKEFEDRYGSVDVKLPATFTQRKLPMDKGDLPQTKKVAKWEHLQAIVNEIPNVRDLPLALLIGNNCPKALEPMQVIPSKDGGPYAKRTRLGWCVIGSPDGGDPSGVKCNSIKICNSVKDITCGLPARPHVVLQNKISDNAISDALQQMWRNDFIETDSEKKALSKEDKTFLDMMKENIKFTEGHYELPLPLRTEDVPVAETSNQCSTEAEEKESNSRALETDQKIPIISPEEVERRWKAAERTGTNKTEAESSKVGTERVVVMPDNRGYAKGRLKPVETKMLRDQGYSREYSAFMSNLFASGFAIRVPKERLKERGYYLIHFGVYHPTKKKMRVVFDCSAEKDGVSLNSRLLQGPDLSNNMIGVLLRYRNGKIPFTADIEAMYHLVRIPVEHRKYLRFFWWEDNDCRKELIECEMCVHPFGAISSKSCVTFALHQTALDNREVYGEEAMETLLTDFYVDDLLKSLDDEQETINLIKNTDGMCAAGGFNLTKFVCTNQKVMEAIPMEKRADGFKSAQEEQELIQSQIENPLGVRWKLHDDVLAFQISFQSDDGSRRGCLATISRVKDILGLAAPFLLKGRKILQKVTTNSISWDQLLPNDEATEWAGWREDLLLLNDMVIQRCYRSGELGKVVDTTLHCFSDASFVGYGVACYLRLVDENGRVEVSLVMGKSRVSPLKPTTVPRLELTAATLSAKIAALLIGELKIPQLETFYWVDNKIVLGYISNKKRRYRVFVANRVRVIDEYTESKNWRYVATKDNPGDFASRGISPKETTKVDTWLKGPEFLRTSDESWRLADPDVEIINDDEEVKVEKKVNTVKLGESSVLEIFEERMSSWHRMIRVMAWILRFIVTCRKTGNRQHSSSQICLIPIHQKPQQGKVRERVEVKDITVENLDHAEQRIIKLIQQRDFAEEMNELKKEKSKKRKGTLWRLDPFVDVDGVLRVGGRLTNAKEDETFKFPAIIPKRRTCTKRLIEWHHNQIQHRGKHTTVCRLREFGLWIVNAGKEVGSLVFRCVRCKWLRGKFGEQMMANLPMSRTTVEPPFTYCGVDYFGPLLVKEGRKTIKRYGVLFTCFSLRAVHVEIASSLEADSFIQALRRFIARRGAVREIRSDNGTNLTGADNELKRAVKEMDQGKISAFLSEQGCDWMKCETNTPTASHMGGVWERMIRTVKSVLTSLLKSSPRVLDEETLRTFLTEAEGIVNSRPLTIENLHDPDSEPLTPNQILTMKSRLVLPPPGVFQEADVYCRKRWRIAQHLANCFWSRWRKEYLQLLQPRQKWTSDKRNLKVDDVVLLKEEGVVRGHWPMGRVTEVHPSDDGLIRSVSVQAGRSILKRPVNKTVLLVASDSSC